ncbi:9882_t:CDS:2, partial [Gigaspora margarita]
MGYSKLNETIAIPLSEKCFWTISLKIEKLIPAKNYANNSYNKIGAATLRHLLDSWVDSQFNTRSNTMNKLATDPNLYTIFSGWYATENLSVFMSNKDVQNKRDDKNFINILFGSKWDNRKVESIGLSKNLDVNHPFFQDLCKTYADYLNSSTILINKKHNSITYTVLESNQDSDQVKLKVGDFVELLEETEGIAYDKIESIFQHQANNGQFHAFFLFKWFQATNKLDPVLECPIHYIQKPEESHW